MLDGSDTKRADDVATERAVRCARCGHALTAEKERLDVDGSHAHTFVNPWGIVFHIAMFRAVDGAFVAGEPEKHASWFEGTVWRFAHCAQCAGHVGWHYVRVDEPGAGATFFGLIEDCIAR